MKTIALTCAALVFALPAFAQSNNAATNGTTAGASTSSGNTTTASPGTKTDNMKAAGAAKASISAQKFVTKAAQSDMFEIQSSKLVNQSDVQDTSTKNFAQKMIEDHTATTQQLKQLVSSKKVDATLPKSMSKSQKAMLDKLKRLSGKALVRQYRQDQIPAHQKAVDLFQSYSKSGDNQALKSWANDTLPKLQQHLQMAQQLPNK